MAHRMLYYQWSSYNMGLLNLQKLQTNRVVKIIPVVSVLQTPRWLDLSA